MNLSNQCKVEGIYQLTTVDEVTGKRTEYPEFKNLIVNGGLDLLCTSRIDIIMGNCWVGTGNTPPAANQTALASFLRGSGSNLSGYPKSGQDYAGTPRPFTWIQSGTRFAAGQATGNIAEVGYATGSAPSAGVFMFSRALIRDASGNPSTITVLPTEALEVLYTVRIYWPADELQSGTITLGGTVHQWKGRIMTVQARSDCPSAMLSDAWLNSTNNANYGGAAYTDVTTFPPNSNVDPVGTRWTGHPVNWGANTVPYVAGTFNRDKILYLPAATTKDAVMAGTDLALGNYGGPRMFVQFTPPIPIDRTQRIEFTLNTSFVQYVP